MSKTYAEVKTARQADILARKPLVPKRECNYCGFHVPPLALWCATECANLYAEEKAELLARDGK